MISGLLAACAVVNTAVTVAVAWPTLRPLLQDASARVQRQFDRLPGPPNLPVPQQPTAAELAEVRLAYVPEGWE